MLFVNKEIIRTLRTQLIPDALECPVLILLIMIGSKTRMVPKPIIPKGQRMVDMPGNKVSEYFNRPTNENKARQPTIPT